MLFGKSLSWASKGSGARFSSSIYYCFLRVTLLSTINMYIFSVYYSFLKFLTTSSFVQGSFIVLNKRISSIKLCEVLLHGAKWVVGVILGIIFFYFSYCIKLLPVAKVSVEYFIIIFLVYLMFISFVGFVRFYRFGHFTTSIQRFWRRSYVIFWLIEGFVFLVFFYLTLRSSDEPVYMYDTIRIYRDFCFVWDLFFFRCIIVSYLLVIMLFSVFGSRWLVRGRLSTFIFVITVGLLYCIWIEFYQAYYIFTFFGGFKWLYLKSNFVWTLASVYPHTRLLNNYTMVCLLAKFWHLVFIFIMWVFVILRLLSVNRIKMPMLVMSGQNVIFLYLLMWLPMFSWLRIIFKVFWYQPTYWCFINCREDALRIFINDVRLLIIGCITVF